MSPTQTQGENVDPKKFKTSEEIDREAHIKDMEIQRRTIETLDKILDLKNIKISRTETAKEQNEAIKGQNHG